MAKAHPGFTLSQLIRTTVDELREARTTEKDAVMQFTGCELELSVTAGADAGGGIKFWLVDASANAHAETVSRIKLNFGPVEGRALQFAAKSGSASSEDHGPENPKRRDKR